MNYLYHAYASNNPAGIDINLGYYALADCIITGRHTSDALLRWCGLWSDADKKRKPYTPRPYVAPSKETEEKVIELYKANPMLKNKEIAKIVQRSPAFVSKLLRAIGVKRNRWDGHIKKGEM